MVKTRSTGFGAQAINRMDTIIDKFGKMMTHRKTTVTLDANGHVTDKSNTDTTFKGDLQYGPKTDRKYARMGSISTGDAVLFVSASQTQSTLITPKESVVIEGTTAGTHDSWSVESKLNAPEVDGGVAVYQMFRCVKREGVTLS